LKVTKYNDGTTIPVDTSSFPTSDGVGQIWRERTTGARLFHSNANLVTNGYQYNWHAVADIKGLCPNGWHVPNDSEWTSLTTYLGGEAVAGGKMKTTGTTYWFANTGATNESGFSALPGGVRTGNFNSIRSYAFFWSATEYLNINSWFRNILYADNGYVNRYNYYNKSIGASIRCLKD
jgi:uncharacterized protein (TIGR02145 family)